MSDFLSASRSTRLFFGRIKELIALRNDFKQTQENQIIPLVYQGKSKEAKELIFGVQLERFGKIRAIVEELEREAAQKAQNTVQQSTQNASDAIRVFTIAGLISVLLAIGMVCTVQSDDRQSVDRNFQDGRSDCRGGVADGALHRRPWADEVGELTQSFGHMTDYLKETARVANSIAGGERYESGA